MRHSPGFAGIFKAALSTFALLALLGLNLPRSILYARIDERIDRMFEAGLVEETRGLLTAGYSPELPALSAIGYRECIGVIRGGLQLEEAKLETKRATRAFVRRQANWFKPSDTRIAWFAADDANIVVAMAEFIQERPPLTLTSVF